MKTLANDIHLDDYCLVSIKGDTASQFLQGQMTLNVKSVGAEQALFGSICNAKGRVISLFHIFRHDQDFFLLLPKCIAQITIDYLKTYSVFYKVTLAVESRQINVTDAPNNLLPINSLDRETANVLIRIQHTPFSITRGEQLAAATENKACSEDNNQYLWYWQLAEHKICWLSAQSSGKFLPHNLNLPLLKAVDFNKGCFTGQEIIARMQYKGQLKQQIALLQTQSNPSSKHTPTTDLSLAKTVFQLEKEVGEVICHSHHPLEGDRFISLLKKPLNSLENFMLDQKNHPILILKE